MPTNVLAIGLNLTAASSFITAAYFLKLKWFSSEETKTKTNNGFAATLGVNGLFVFIAGFYILAGTPYNAPYNEFFGSIFTLFGMLLLMGAWCIKNDWDLRPVSYFGAFVALHGANLAYIDNLLIHNASYLPVFGSAALAGFGLLLGTHVRSPWASRITAILIIILGLVTLYLGVTAFQGHMARGFAPPKT